MTPSSLHIHPALYHDADTLMRLINDAYASNDQDRSWTNESKVVIGERISLPEMQALLNEEDVTVIVARQDDRIVGTVTLVHAPEYSKLNMLAVDPAYQQYGIGKQLIAYSETFLRDRYHSAKIKIDVVATRHELISFYQRRGFVQTGHHYPYPVDLVATQPIDDTLSVLVLEKAL